MSVLDSIIILLYFAGLIAVSLVLSRRIRSSEDMFIAGRNSSWWLSGVSSYMTIFSASTFVVWGGVAYKSGLVAAIVGMSLGVASFIVGRFFSGKWRELKIKSPGEFLTIRFGHSTVRFYTVAGIIGRAVHTGVALYAVAVVACALVQVPEGSVFASTGIAGDAPSGHLCIWWALALLGAITLVYTIAGGFPAVLMTDVIQFGVLLAVVVFMIPLSLHAVGGFGSFIEGTKAFPGFFSGTSETYTWFWLFLWMILHASMIGGDWPFVQRYISVPTARDARRSTYLIGALYLVTPLIWYLPTMVYRVLVPGPGMDADPVSMTRLGEGAYVNMSKLVLMDGMLGMMLAAMLSATMSNVSGTLNVYANVFTYEIWEPLRRRRGVDEKSRMRAGRLFTLVFGLAIVAVSMLVPFAGGAEKVVVTVLTMVLCPLYIPSIWGLFSKRLTGGRLMWAMLVSWAVAFTAKFTVPADVLSPTLIETIGGCIVPLAILAVMELYAASKGQSSPGYDALRACSDPDAQRTPGPEVRKAVKAYSNMAVSCFCITLCVIAVLLVSLLLAGDPRTLAVKGIVLWFVAGIMAVVAAYAAYRIRDNKHNINHAKL